MYFRDYPGFGFRNTAAFLWNRDPSWPLASGSFSLPSVEVEAYSGISVTGSVEIPAFEITVNAGSHAEISLPEFALAAQGELPALARASLELPAFTIQARGSAKADITLPALNIEASTATGIIASADIILPRFRSTLAGALQPACDLDERLPKFRLSAASRQGAIASADIRLYPFRLLSEAKEGNIASLIEQLPSFELDGSLFQDLEGDASLTMAALIISASKGWISGRFDDYVLRYSRD